MRTEILVAIGVVAIAGIAVAFLRRPDREAPQATKPPAARSTFFVFVKVPESIMPIDRGAKYEDPLDAALKRESVGEVTGGGSQLGDEDPEGKRKIEWVGLDVELTDLDRGLPVLKRELQRLGVPKATTLEFTRAGVQVVEPVTS